MMTSDARRRHPRTAFLRAGAMLAGAFVVTLAGRVHAEESPYCRKVQAHAAGDAALLFAPSVQAQALRFPRNGIVDTGITSGRGFQVRTGLSWSPLDFYKGFRVLRVGDAECARADVARRADDVLGGAEEALRLRAFRAQGGFLDAKRPVYERIGRDVEDLFAAHTTTLSEAIEARSRVAALQRRSVEVQGEIARLEAKGVDGFRDQIPEVVRGSKIDATTMRYERELSHLRSLDGWDVRVSAAVIPESKIDYAGFIQIGWNIGNIPRNASESRFLAAREEELRHARYETDEKIRRFRRELKAWSGQIEKGRDIIEAQLNILSKARDAITSSGAAPPQVLALIDLESLLAESELTFFTTLRSELKRIEEMTHGE